MNAKNTKSEPARQPELRSPEYWVSYWTAFSMEHGGDLREFVKLIQAEMARSEPRMSNYTLRGEKCSICGQRMAVSNRTGAHNACVLSLRMRAKALREIADADDFLQRQVEHETAPPWERHPVAWDNVRVCR